MTTDSPPPDGGSPRSHRAASASNVSKPRLVALAVATAVIFVLVAVGIVGWLRPHDDTTAVGTPTSTSTSRSTSPTPTRSGSPTTSPSQSPTPSKTPSKTASSPPTKKPPSSPSAPPIRSTSHSSPPAPQVPRDYPVVVLNETPITGLAAKVAGQLRQRGWTVTGVANWIGEIPSTTVYFPDGYYSRAQRLAADLGVSRIKPRVGGMLPNRLTVVLHDVPK